MLVKNVTEKELYQALKEVNKKYNDNVIFNRSPEAFGKKIQFTLRVKDSKKPGARRGITGRRMKSACYHVHGDFFDGLLKINKNAIIETMYNTIDINGGNWIDYNIGSIIDPKMASKACNC